MYNFGDRWYQTYGGDHFKMHTNIGSLHCISVAKVILYVNYISIKTKQNTDSMRVRAL